MKEFEPNWECKRRTKVMNEKTHLRATHRNLFEPA